MSGTGALVADRRPLGRVALVLARPLEELEQVTVGIVEEDLRDAVAPRHWTADEGYALLGEAGARRVQIVYFKRKVVRQPECRASARIGSARPARRVSFGQEVDLVLSKTEPGAGEGEVRRTRYFLQPQCVGIEAARAVEVRDDEACVLESHGHAAYRNLAPPRKEAQMPLIRVELFDYRMSDETSAALIEKLTDALCEATHPGLRDHTWVIVEGHSPKNWGLGGKPWPVDQMPPAPGS